MKKTLALIALALTGCAPSVGDFQSAGAAPDKRAQDYAACKITATQTAASVAGAGSFVYNLQYKETLTDCMTAKGYTTSED